MARAVKGDQVSLPVPLEIHYTSFSGYRPECAPHRALPAEASLEEGGGGLICFCKEHSFDYFSRKGDKKEYQRALSSGQENCQFVLTAFS